MMKPRKEFWPDSVAQLPSIVTFFVTAGRFEPSVMSDVKVIVSPFAALLMALARLLGVLTSKSLGGVDEFVMDEGFGIPLLNRA
jgi:hypothetical protein